MKFALTLSPRATFSASSFPVDGPAEGVSPFLSSLSAYSVTGYHRPLSTLIAYESLKNSETMTSPFRISWSTTPPKSTDRFFA